MNWQGDERFTFKDVDQADELRHYFDFNPARGDFGFVAEVGGLVIGVVWLLFFDARNKGYGFVTEGVPELIISVRSGYRGQGVGEKMMRLVVDESQSQKLSRISLSVETGNPAISLYRKFGFTPVPHIAEGTFVLNI